MNQLDMLAAPPPVKLYGTIYADPPWWESGGGKIKRGADRHYPLMKTREIAALPVSGLALPDAHLWMWVTNNFLMDAREVIAAWGFRYVTNRAWVKTNDDGTLPRRKLGLGQYVRGDHELLLFAVRGRVPYKVIDGVRQQVRSVLYAPVTRHSEKPPQARADVERMSPGPFLELFARQPSPGWDVWGNEVKTDVDLAVQPAAGGGQCQT